MGLGYSLFARHYSGSRGFFPFLRLLRCFSSPACLPGPMYSGTDTRALPRVGFPIRTSRGQWMVSSSPGLFAAAHVLLRLLAPRHPPCALSLLIMKNTVFAAMEFSRCARDIEPAQREPARGRSLKTQQRGTSRSTLFLDELGHRNATRQKVAPCYQENAIYTLDGPSAYRSNCSGIPRKEVIQPQLPLRLPCYDFTPITNPTFGGSLLAVRTPTSGVTGFRGVTGGVYKARERIHRGIADPRLLATPPSWRRVSASNPNRDRLFGIRSPSRVCSPLYRPM